MPDLWFPLSQAHRRIQPGSWRTRQWPSRILPPIASLGDEGAVFDPGQRIDITSNVDEYDCLRDGHRIAIGGPRSLPASITRSFSAIRAVATSLGEAT
jgi:hypothetical protein